MAVDNNAAALKKANEKNEADNREWYDKLVDLQSRYDELQKLADSRKHYNDLAIKERRTFNNEKAELEKRATTAEAQAKTYQKDLKAVQEEAETLRSEKNADTNALKDKDKRIDAEKRNANQVQRNANELVKKAQNDLARVTQEKSQIEAQRDEANAQLRGVQSELQEIFQESTDVTLEHLIDRTRIVQEQHTLAERSSKSSLSEENRKHAVHGPSLASQLEAVGYDSASEHGDVDGDDDDNKEDTIQLTTLPSSPPLSFNEVVTLADTAPVAAPAPPPQPVQPPPPAPPVSGFSGISSVSSRTIAPTPPPPVLSFSGINSVSTRPIAPARLRAPCLGFSRISTISTSPIDPPARALPHRGWLQPLLLLCFLLAIVALAPSIAERSMWTAANDLSRRRVVDISLSGASVWNPFLGAFANIDELIGVGHGILG